VGTGVRTAVPALSRYLLCKGGGEHECLVDCLLKELFEEEEGFDLSSD
jgi:hypothetical protein